jgi:site-specific recombinase XerD
MSPPLDGEIAPTQSTSAAFPCTFATLVTNIHGKVTRDEFKSLKSAANVIAKWLNKDPATWVVTSAKDVVDAMHGLHPIRHNIAESYLRVTSSRMMKILRLSGTAFLSGHCKTELPVAWRAPVSAARLVDDRRLQCLMPFIRFQSGKGRSPSDVTQSNFDAYCAAVDESSQRKNKLGSKQSAQRDWNYFAKNVEVWPKLLFVFLSKREDYMLPEDQLPPAWAEFEAKKRLPFRGNRKFGRRRRRLKEVTVESRDYTFRRIISAAIAGGIDRHRLQTMADVCDREVLETAFNFILDRNERDVEGTCDVCRLAGLMYAVAEQWVGVTGKELEAYDELYEAFEHIQHGMAEKNQRLLAKFATDASIAAFLKTPKRVMDEYVNTAELTQHDCIRMQMAAAMSILTRVLIRMENLKQIQDQTHLINSGYGSQRHVMLIFGEKEVKNDAYLETILSPRVVGVLDTYMQRAWPKLKRGRSTNCLFPGYGGKHKAASTFGPQLADFVFRETGIRVTPHQFRHLGGYFHLLRYPGDYASVQKMLGHLKIETTIKYYTGTMERRAAFDKYDGHIDARIDEADAAEAVTKKLRTKSIA